MGDIYCLIEQFLFILNIMEKMFKYIKENKATVIALFLIFFLGLFLRTYRISEFMHWGDPGRDSLVAKKIIINGRFSGIRPFASGSGNVLLNSPLYYNLLALFWMISPSAQSLTLFFALLNTLIIFINFQIGRELEDDNLGLLLAFLTAVTYLFINFSRSSYQPFLLPLVVSFQVLFLLRSLRSLNWQNLSLLILSFWAGFHIHYSILTSAPILFLFIVYLMYKYYQKDKFNTFLLVLFCFFNAELWFFSTNSGGSINLFDFMKNLFFRKRILTGNTTISLDNFFDIIKNLFGSDNGLIPNFSLLFVIVFSIYFLSFLYKKNSKTFLKYLLVFLFFFSSLFLMISPIAIYEVYLTPYYYLFIILLAFVIYQFKKRSLFVGMGLLAFFSYNLQISNYNFFEQYPFDEFGQSEYISQNIINDIELSAVSLDNFRIIEKSKKLPFYGWYDPSFWYFLEDYYQESFLTLAPSFNNLQPVNKNVKVIYLICREFEKDSNQYTEENCLDPVIKVIKDNSLVFNTSILVAKEDFKTTFVLYKLSLKENFNNFPWAIHYRSSSSEIVRN
jgi:hypothetical protein